MIKIKSIKFNNHKILGDLYVDFSDGNGNPVDTILIAGENGVGKSTFMNVLYEVLTFKNIPNIVVEIQNDTEIKSVEYGDLVEYGQTWIKYDGKKTLPTAGVYKNDFNFKAIYSDIDIVFDTKKTNQVTSLDVDTANESQKSSLTTSSSINQLIVDLQAVDDSVLAEKVRHYNGEAIEINDDFTKGKIDRFKSAFNYMFDGLTFYGVENKDNTKKIFFKRNENKIPIEDLSSGEKQIVYRGLFLLKDKNSLQGAVVFIDEPEISMHPEWQKKIMEYYKRMFRDEKGKQTSQIFAVTHSPFIIHNDLRKNDKVIVFKIDSFGKIEVADKPSYYNCSSVDSIKDAFNIYDFNNKENIVYLEGRTDEKYFNKLLDVFNIKDDIQFKWIGNDLEGQGERFTGSSSLNHAYNFCVGNNVSSKFVMLYDCDTNMKPCSANNVFKMMIQKYKNETFKTKGIENALIVKNLKYNRDDYYTKKTKTGAYGENKGYEEFEKMKFCDFICSLQNEVLIEVFENLKAEFDKILKVFSI